MDRLNKGRLYGTEQKILRQGSVNVNGGDESFIITERVGKEGKLIRELYCKVGFINPNTKKREGKQDPDYLGNFKFNTFDFKMAGWKSKDRNEKEYVSVKVQFNEEQKPAQVKQDEDSF